MMRRLFWFVLGALSGVYATVWVRRTAGEMAEKLSPSAVADQVLHVLKALAKAAMSGAGALVDVVSERVSGPSGPGQSAS